MNWNLSLFLFACAFATLAGHATQCVQPPTPVHTLTGTELFHEKGCEHCHGTNFAGIEDKGPSLQNVGKRLKKESIAHQIHDGGQSMPAFGDSLQPDEITALVDMLAKKKRAPKH